VKRGVFDVLRRGIDNTIANWPLLLIRLGEMMLFAILAIATVIVAFLPILVSLGIELSKLTTPEDLEDAGLALLSKWVLLLWVVVAILALLLIFLAVHAFVEAGSARVYIDGERAAGPLVQGPRSRFRMFSMERWMAGGRAGWWSVFWIYNIAWAGACAILLIPLLPTIVGMLLFHNTPPAAVATGCIGLVVTGLLLMVVGSVTGMWINRAINEWALRQTGARESLSIAWTALRADLGRHVLIFLAVFVVALAGSSFFATFGFFAAFGEAVGRHGMFNLITLPLRIFGSLLNTAFSAAVSAWYLAAFAALTTNDERSHER
jgi:hypothetical protein